MLFGFEASLYSIVFQFVSTQAIDTFHKSDQQMTLFIISNKADELERELLVKTHHGMTRFTGEGSHTHEDRVMLYTVVSAAEVNDVYEIIKILVKYSTHITGVTFSVNLPIDFIPPIIVIQVIVATIRPSIQLLFANILASPPVTSVI